MAVAGPSRPSAGPVRTSFNGPSPNLSSMPRLQNTRNILMELRKVCQHPYLSAPMLEDETLALEEQQKKLIGASGKLVFLKQLLPKLKERGHRVLLFSQFKIALNRTEDFLNGEGIKFLRLDGDVQQAVRQKSMDAFNAPGSDLFIFLLTTRAGGVGINLATADTVIIYDPDFNPHQDLQAIARAHRYGQERPVLVFKLMMKDTVEEQIVFKGKKKMVLDHLVVQNLNTAEEEVDIDSIIMHGTKALYDKTEDNERGIEWDSKTVDNLIDDAEKSAHGEWEEFKLRWKLEDEAKERGEKPEPSKEARTFGFAKIWEAGAGSSGLAEIEELTEEKELEDDENALAELARHAPGAHGEVGEVGKRQVSQAHAKEMERQARIARELEMTLALGDTPVKKKKGKKGKKGKGKWEPEEASSDPDFAVIEDHNSEDSDYPGEQPDIAAEDLLGEEDVRAGVIGKKGMMGQQHGPDGTLTARKAAKALARAQKRAGIIPGEGENLGSPSKTGSPSKIKLTEAEKATRKQARLQAKADARAEAIAAGRDPNVVGSQSYAAGLVLPPNHPSSAPSSDPPNPINIDTLLSSIHPKPPSPDARPRLDILAQITEGQEVLQWLYHVLKEFADENALAMWAKIAVTELPTEEREGYYRFLARSADARLSALGYDPKFEIEKEMAAVRRLIMLKRNVLPPGARRASGKPILPVPQGMGVLVNGGNAVAGPSGIKSTTPTTTPTKGSPFVNAARKSVTPSHTAFSHIELPNGISKTKKVVKPPPVPLPGMYNFNGRDPSLSNGLAAGNGSTTPTSPAPPPYSTHAGAVANRSAPQVCPACMKPGHTFIDCTVRLSIQDLAMIRTGVMTLEGEPRLKAIQEVERQEQAYRDHGIDVPAHPYLPGNGTTLPKLTSGQSTALANSNGTGKRSRENGSQVPSYSVLAAMDHHPKSYFHQVLDRNPVQPEAGPSKKPRMEQTATGSPALNTLGGVGKRPACIVCGGAIHLVTECHLVQGGPEALRAELKRLHHSNERYNIISNMLAVSLNPQNAKLATSHHGQTAQQQQLLRTLHAQLQNQHRQPQPEAQITQSQPIPARADSPAQSGPMCAYCGLACGKSLKSCTETFGGRKALKMKIRELQDNGEVNDVLNEMRLDQLFTLYGEWPK